MHICISCAETSILPPYLICPEGKTADIVQGHHQLNRIAPLHIDTLHTISQGWLELAPLKCKGGKKKKASWALLVQISGCEEAMTSHLLRLQQNVCGACGVCVSLEVEWFMALWEGGFQAPRVY